MPMVSRAPTRSPCARACRPGDRRRSRRAGGPPSRRRRRRTRRAAPSSGRRWEEQVREDQHRSGRVDVEVVELDRRADEAREHDAVARIRWAAEGATGAAVGADITGEDSNGVRGTLRPEARRSGVRAGGSAGIVACGNPTTLGRTGCAESYAGCDRGERRARCGERCGDLPGGPIGGPDGSAKVEPCRMARGELGGMDTLISILHVTTGDFIVGPMAILLMTAMRRCAPATRSGGGARKSTMVFRWSLLTILMAWRDGDGARGIRATCHDPWILWSIILYVIAFLLSVFLVVPSMKQGRRSAVG